MFVRASLNLMDLDDDAEAVPRLLVLLPLMRSFFGAGVCAAPLRPALFFAMALNKETPSAEEASFNLLYLSLLSALVNDEAECSQNQQVVYVLTSQKCVGVFDVQKSFHNYLFLLFNFGFHAI